MTPTLVQVKPGAYWDFLFRTSDGGLIGITLDESEVGDIEIVPTDSAPTFEGDPSTFRLGVERVRRRSTETTGSERTGRGLWRR